MRVLLVVHNFLPAHAAGTEVYTAQLARRLVRAGHQVHVVTTEKDVGRHDLSSTEREWEGVGVTELVNNLYYHGLRETWDHPAIDAWFAAVLERVRPDVVHFQHILYLSIGCVEQAARRGAGILFTLHDYWLQCPRFGQRIHAEGTICHTIEFARCGECLTSFKFRQSALERWSGRLLAGVHATMGIDLSRAAKQAAQSIRRARPDRDAASAVDPAAAARLAVEVAERDRAMRDRVVPHVFRFIAPSRFLRERLIEWGIPPERIEYLRTVVDEERSGAAARTVRAGSRPGKLRIGFVGTLAPHKGPQVLLEAWSKLSDATRARATLELHGPSLQDTSFRAALAARAAEVGARLQGAVARDRVGALLADLDLLVVPSVWYENAPLVILEALALRTPILVSAIGGMSELVDDGRSGGHFAVGDSDDLARKLCAYVEQPQLLAALFADGSAGADSECDEGRVEALYRAALAARHSPQGR